MPSPAALSLFLLPLGTLAVKSLQRPWNNGVPAPLDYCPPPNSTTRPDIFVYAETPGADNIAYGTHLSISACNSYVGCAWNSQNKNVTYGYSDCLTNYNYVPGPYLIDEKSPDQPEWASSSWLLHYTGLIDGVETESYSSGAGVECGLGGIYDAITEGCEQLIGAFGEITNFEKGADKHVIVRGKTEAPLKVRIQTIAAEKLEKAQCVKELREIVGLYRWGCDAAGGEGDFTLINPSWSYVNAGKVKISMDWAEVRYQDEDNTCVSLVAGASPSASASASGTGSGTKNNLPAGQKSASAASLIGGKGSAYAAVVAIAAGILIVG